MAEKVVGGGLPHFLPFWPSRSAVAQCGNGLGWVTVVLLYEYVL